MCSGYEWVRERKKEEEAKIIYFIYHVFLHFLLHNKFSLSSKSRVSKEKILRVVKEGRKRKKSFKGFLYAHNS